ncbi:hypothetical protein pf16_87 [Pseudomonas phage pf16]|uniref:Nucleotidase n=1 Tax=Pseudomonas phage pf16 TaxID=1815630 RepID=A0A1S5R629_9CAUD|nr:hypothetical protein FDG98_gp211 [Pseudomonas phage pf16]AND75010.1 hypothetical protein pf16_87 [Pseudomonas phage pf16]
MAIIGVDVDLTVVDSDSGLFEHCNMLSGLNLNHEIVTERMGHVPYDFSKIYPELTDAQIMRYWGQRDLYDFMEPKEGAVEVLRQLSKQHHIVFVTILTGDHYDSKRHFLDRHFPFADALVCTKQKDFARIDMLVDDRVENLNACAKVGIAPILFESAYAQTVEPVFLLSTIKSWNHLLDDPRGVYNSLLSRRRVA